MGDDADEKVYNFDDIVSGFAALRKRGDLDKSIGVYKPDDKKANDQ